MLLASALAATSAFGARSSATDQYVGDVPAATGDQSPSESLTPIAQQNGVVTPDSVKNAAEKAKDNAKTDSTSSGSSEGGTAGDAAGGVPPGTVGPAPADTGSKGFTLTNFNTPAGAAALAFLLIAGGIGLLSMSRRHEMKFDPKAPSS